MAPFVNDLRLTELATGEGSGTWGTTTNTNLELIAESFSFGTEAITTNADTHTTTIADGSTDPGRSIFLKYTGTLDSACTITIGPNTVSKLWFIENATSGSQSIIVSQGSGANITIPNGQTKAIYSDGAGSGAAMVDAFQNLSIPDLFIDDDLTIGDDLVFSSDSAVITFGADGDTTLTHTDGSGLTLHSTNKLMFNDASQFIQGSSATVLSLGATDEIDLTATAIDVNGTIDVSGNATLGGTLGVTGAVTANAGISIDNITIDGTEIDLSSGDLTIDVAGDIILDADGGDVKFSDAGTVFGSISTTDNTGIIIGSQDVGLRFRQQSAGAAVFPRQPDGSALDATLDLGISNSRFQDIHVSRAIGNGATGLQFNDGSSDDLIPFSMTASDTVDNTISLGIASKRFKDLYLSGGLPGTASGELVINDNSVDSDFRVESDNNANMLFVDAGNDRVGIGATPVNSALYVGKGGGFAGQLLIEGGSGSTYVGIGHGTDNPALHWQTGDFRFATSTASDLTGFSEKMRIMSTGKVLIGDTASHTTDLLQIETPASGGGHGIQIRRNDSNSDQGVGRVMFGNNTDTELASVSAKTDGATDSGALLFNTSATGGSLTERFRISSTGSLTMNGAAGTSPIFELINNDNEDISTGRETSIRFSGHRSGGEDVVNAQIGGHHFGSADDDRGMILMYTNAGSATLAERLRLTPDDAVFNEGSADTDFRVESDANANGLFLDASTGHASVGVTAATTTYGGTFRLLQIGNGAGYGIFNGLTSATANDAGVASFFGQTSGTSGYDVVGGMRIALAADSSSNSEGKIEFYTATGGNLVEAMEITNSQQLILHGVKDDTTSDAANMNIRSSDGLVRRSTSSRRYKNTITDATHGLTELLKLRSVTYKGNNDGDRLFGGLIAEEVHDAGLTEFVQYNSDDEPDALAYGHMISLCIKAIQEQQALIETLQAEVAALKGG